MKKLAFTTSIFTMLAATAVTSPAMAQAETTTPVCLLDQSNGSGFFTVYLSPAMADLLTAIAPKVYTKIGEEICEDNLDNDCDGRVDEGCGNGGIADTCGNGTVDAGEECDDGNSFHWDTCSNFCKKNAYCGDGEVNGLEQCDDGNRNNDDACSNRCRVNADPAEPRCGDGEVNQDSEECDDGNDSNSDSCTNQCKNAVCGDGIVQEDEECDGSDECTDDCKIVSPPARCGDAEVNQENEQCDDGNEDNTDACTNECQNAKCGDGIVHAGVEECDDGNDIDDDACSNECKTVVTPDPRCGDGAVNQDSEECDDGNDVNDDACTNECKNPVCGDGIVQAGEECDGGEGCTSDCKNEIVVPDPRCGDGEVNQDSEECDDGNDVNDDACTNECKNPVCGDGIVQAGEECDGGEGCTSECKNEIVVPDPRCGDGEVNQDSEECDDGNDVNDDACTNECKNPVCGDGIVQAGEDCDGTEGCGDDCKIPAPSRYGDGGEDCQACITEKCGQQEEDCFGDPECAEAIQCHIQNKCLDAFLGPFTCLCGEGVGVPECQAVQNGDFQGPCAESILASLGTAGDTQQTFVRFANTDFKVGVAHQALVCAGRFCAVECKELIYNTPN